jgi:predicted nucleic acid-binding protein
LRKIALDAGPLIGLFYRKDIYHRECVRGFEQLAQQQTILLTPLPILFEVYKWLLQRTQPTVAHNALAVMQDSLHLLPLEQSDFEQIQDIVTELPQWQGSLEDATVVFTALRYRSPVWTYNFRDFSIFQALEFWTPDPKRRLK